MKLNENRSTYTMFMSLIFILFCQETAAALIVSYEGGTVILPCTESPTIYPIWNGPDLDGYNYDKKPKFNPALGEKLSRLSWDPDDNKSLIINNVMKNDSGTYEYSYTLNGNNKVITHDLSIRVRPMAPVINNTETLDGTRLVVRGTEGQELTLKCTSTGGYPGPLLYWYKDNTKNQPLDTTKTSEKGSDGTYTVVVTHTFTPRSQDDDVTFVCQSSFSPPQPSEQRTQVKLLLNLKPSPPMVTSYPVVEGVSGKVSDCRTSGFRPDNVDVWFQMNGNNVTSNTSVNGNTGQTFNATAWYTTTLRKQQNGKTLVCYVAHQTLQTPLTGSGTADVRFRPLTAALTGSVFNIVVESNAKTTLTCTSGTSNPKSTITWYRDDVQITNPAAVIKTIGDYNGVVTSQIYEFAPTRSMDGDQVYCTVHNSIDGQPAVRSETITLDLQYHPIVQIKGDAQIIERQTMSLKCEADAKPFPIFTWYLNGNPIPVDSSNYGNVSELVIEDANRTHGGQYTCKATNGFAPNGTAHTNVAIKFRPLTAVLTGSVSNIVAESNANITLTCTSGTSNPKSTITWYRDGVQIPNQAAVIETNGDFNGVVTSQILELAPTRSMDGEKVYCEVNNSIGGQLRERSETKTLDLLYHPIVTLSGNTEVQEGNTTIFKCTVNSKPKSTVTWYHNDLALPASDTIALDSSFEYRIDITNRNNAGNYKCAANNKHEPSDEKKTTLLVKYAPDVVVSSSNVTVNDTEAEVTCTPSGVPDTYTYSAWEHIWPGVGVIPHSGLGNNPILKLSSLSYEYSGIYRCSASNGVTGSLNPNAGFGETYLQVKTYPIITTPNPMKISSQLSIHTTFPLEFYSNSFPNTVECFRNTTKWNVSLVIEDRTITLPVFDTTITTMGFFAKVSLLVTHMDHFGAFTCRISNVIGAQTVNVDIVPEGPPEPPYSVLIEDVQSSSVTISWLPGFHGGFDQMFTIEYSNRADEWLQVNITGGQYRTMFNKTIRGLQTGTRYFFRIKSVNERGTSDYSNKLNVTTKVIETTSPTSNLTGIIGGAFAGIAVFVVVGIVAFIVIRKRKSKSNDNETGRQSLYREEPANDGDGMTINAAYVSTDSLRVQPPQNTSHGTDIYTQVDKTKKTGMNNENNTYAVVNKSKKEGKLVEEQNQKKGKTDKGKGKKGKKGKPGKRTGTNVYENAQELNVYGNIGQHNDIREENIYEHREEESPKRNLNKDGLIYADLMFENNNTGQRKLIIHGLENGTDYVQVDFNRKAEPLPDSDEEDGDK